MTETMLAARWHGRRDVRVEAVPIPSVGPDDVLLRVSWCGICGTDVEEYRDGPVVIPVGAPNRLTGQQAPITLGHEFSGTVVELGADVAKVAGAAAPLRLGDRVVPEICLACSECWYCQRGDYALCADWAAIGLHGDGGLAEFARVPARQCVQIPDSIADDAAALIEPTEVAVRAVRKGGIRAGDTVAIVGDGAVGLITLQVARAAGAATVLLVGHRPRRLDIGRSLGAAATFDSRTDGWLEGVRELTGGRGVDVAIECGGRASAIEDSIAVTRKGGAIVLLAVIGVPIAVNTWPIVEGERTIVGSVQHHLAEDLPAAVHLLATGLVDVHSLVSRRITLGRIVDDGLEPAAKGGATAGERPSDAEIKVLVSTREDQQIS